MSQANRGRVFLPSRHKLSGIFVSRGSQSSWKIAKLSWCFRTVSVAKRSVAVGIVSEPEICHGCRILIACSARIRVQLSFLSCLGSRNLFAKTVTSNLPLFSVLALVFLFYYQIVWVLTRIPNGMDNYSVIGDLVVNNKVSNYKPSSGFFSCF